jgi:uncharacterized membrane protein (UPF0127 family)
MTSKSNQTKSTKKRKKKNYSFTRIVLISIAFIITFAFLVFSLYKPGKKKSTFKPTTSVTKSEPSFRKDGILSIIPSDSPPINLEIEIADDEGEIMRGLMDRLSMPENAGMFFIFDKDEPRSFWMKNTYISLDIIYINSNKEIVSIQKYTQPKTTSSIPSEEPAMYVLEVNAGFVDKFGINAGDRIESSH